MAHKAISWEDPIVQVFFPCQAGTTLLEHFAATRPQDYSSWSQRILETCGIPRSLVSPNGMRLQLMCKCARFVVRFRHVRTICKTKR